MKFEEGDQIYEEERLKSKDHKRARLNFEEEVLLAFEERWQAEDEEHL